MKKKVINKIKNYHFFISPLFRLYFLGYSSKWVPIDEINHVSTEDWIKKHIYAKLNKKLRKYSRK